ncbi:hypothetical protein [Caballeronia ptereochthonis]|uniref:Uncharacterized protein n=1 Tax=Caballeronia ptereochthonis TaxID=1777144 RepID=A0A158BPU2_9BURK|nr:hypothetical protein [Caballeronia ptereochthonis]SAK71307.1 hypothetical protein AWB83_03450 [Caballeronia ptereochthonis]
MPDTPSQQQIDEVFDIVKKATTDKRPERQLTKYEKALETFSKWLLTHQLMGFSLAIILAGLSYFLHDTPLAKTASATVTLSQLLGVALSLVVIAFSVPFFHRLLKTPFSQFFHLAESSATFNLQYVERLATCETAAIRYVLTCYEGERIAFEKRCGILVGSIEKIGFFPALAGLGTLSIGLSKLSAMQSWANALIFLILAFYILSTAAFAMTQRQDRVISLLKYCLETFN